VKFETTPAFDGDVRRLKRSGLFEEFRRVVKDDFIPAAERQAERPGSPRPQRLRVKSMRGARGVMEMTWSFTSPDGRATFEWVEIDGEKAIRWRRVGDHSIFGNP
jgi:hypothetical protein